MSRVPKIRFKEFSGEWKEKNGNDVFLNISDKKHNSDLPILAITQDKGAIPRELIDYNITVTDKSVDSYKVVKKGDFIISLRSFQGGIEYSSYHGICSPAYIILRPQIKINDYYFKIYLKTPRYIKNLTKKLEGIRDGKMISYKYFSETLLPLPSLPEQEKIANFLSNVDIKIEKLERKKELWEEYKKGMMQKIFSQEIRFSPNGTSSLHSQRNDENGEEYPQWEEKRLGEITQEKSIRNKKAENNFVLSVSNTKGFIPQSEQFLDREVASQDKTNYKIISKGDFAYNPSRINVGSIAYLDKYDSGILSPMYVIFALKDNINPKYLLEFIATNDFFQQMKLLLAGSVRESLVYKDFCKIKLEIPCFLEQEKIVYFLSSIDSKIEITEKELEGMKEFKKGLLQGMFV